MIWLGIIFCLLFVVNILGFMLVFIFVFIFIVGWFTGLFIIFVSDGVGFWFGLLVFIFMLGEVRFVCVIGFLIMLFIKFNLGLFCWVWLVMFWFGLLIFILRLGELLDRSNFDSCLCLEVVFCIILRFVWSWLILLLLVSFNFVEVINLFGKSCFKLNRELKFKIKEEDKD